VFVFVSEFSPHYINAELLVAYLLNNVIFVLFVPCLFPVFPDENRFILQIHTIKFDAGNESSRGLTQNDKRLSVWFELINCLQTTISFLYYKELYGLLHVPEYR